MIASSCAENPDSFRIYTPHSPETMHFRRAGISPSLRGWILFGLTSFCGCHALHAVMLVTDSGRSIWFHSGQWDVLSLVQPLSRVWMFATPWTAACQASLSITSSQNLLKLMSIKSVMPSNHLILCHPFLLLPSIFPSIRVFSNNSVLCIRWPKYWSFSFSISPSSEYSGLVSFRMDGLDLLAIQGTLKSLLQHHISKVSTLRPAQKLTKWDSKRFLSYIYKTFRKYGGKALWFWSWQWFLG